MATTPPIIERVKTPDAPLHGPKYDSRRRSSRIHTKQMHSPQAQPQTSHSHSRKHTLKPTSSQTLSPPSSPSSPEHQHPVRPYSRHSKSHAHDPSHLATYHSALRPAVGQTGAEMLPTPVKTPRKRLAVPESTISGTARVLFGDHATDQEDLMPTPRKARKGTKHISFSLESFEQEKANGERQVEIFTDSKERVPELDEDSDNPFIVKRGKRRAAGGQTPGSVKPQTRSTKHGMSKEVDEAVENGDGMVYTFRGKKIYRPFSDADASSSDPAIKPASLAQDDTQSTIAQQVGPAVNRPFTRSSIKPRLLFPPSADPESDNFTAEEADTDIETTTKHVTEDIDAATPHRNRFVPMTPPTTMRKKKVSPFDSWARTKPVARSVSASKRQGDMLEKDEMGSVKRSRGKRAEVY